VDTINAYLGIQKLPNIRIAAGKVRMNYKQVVAMILLKVQSNVARFRSRKQQVSNRTPLFSGNFDFKDVFTLQSGEATTLPHVTYICGGSGVGKTLAVRTMLRSLSETQGVPVFWIPGYNMRADQYPANACFVLDDIFDANQQGAHAYVTFVNSLMHSQRLIVISNFGPKGTGLLPWRLSSWLMAKSRMTKPVLQIDDADLKCPGFARRAGGCTSPHALGILGSVRTNLQRR
jgi:hypothetical protein